MPYKNNEEYNYTENNENVDTDNKQIDITQELSFEELERNAIDEHQTAITTMFEYLNSFMESGDYIFPIMKKLNYSNFHDWFSRHMVSDLVVLKKDLE
jgi:hypothetical protein